MSPLLRDVVRAIIRRSIGLTDERRYTPYEEIQSIRCERCDAEAPLIRREPMKAREPLNREIWTFECIRCARKMQQLDKW